MEVTRSRTFESQSGNHVISVTLTDADLTAEERAPSLLAFRGMLLDLAADRHIATAMFRAGLFHRKEEKNQKIAGVKLAKIEEFRSGIMRSAK